MTEIGLMLMLMLLPQLQKSHLWLRNKQIEDFCFWNQKVFSRAKIILTFSTFCKLANIVNLFQGNLSKVSFWPLILLIVLPFSGMRFLCSYIFHFLWNQVSTCSDIFVTLTPAGAHFFPFLLFFPISCRSQFSHGTTSVL